MVTERIISALHVIANLDVGGAQEVVRSLAPALNRLGCHTAVLALRDGPMRPLLEQEGVTVRVVAGRSRSLVRDPRAVAELWRIRGEVARFAAALDADLIQTHLLRSMDFLVLAAAPRRRPAVIWTFHNARLDLRADQVPDGGRLLDMKRRGYRSLYHHLSRRAAAMVAVSSEVGSAVRTELRPAWGRLVVIPNGVDVARFPADTEADDVRRGLGVGSEELLVICVAKLYAQKGHATLLEAFAGASATDGRLRLALVGDGPLRDDLSAQIQRLGLAERVTLLGQRLDAARLVAASDLFVLPSLWEGLPMALLEAMASRKPVIASRVSGTDEVLTGGQHGVLVEPESVAELRDALLRLAADPALRQRLGDAGRARVESDFSVDVQARAHLDLYRRVTRPRGSAA